MTTLLKTSDNKFYSVAKNPRISGPWLICEPVNIVEAKAPCHRWTGWRIPIATLWQDILAFLEWSYQETKSETVVHLFYHEVEGWHALVLPQEGWTSMKIKILEEHANRIPTFHKLPQVEGEWRCMGTVHHHCSMGAFQSGGDASDEKTKEGLHITVGGMGTNRYSLDGRASLAQTMTEVCWSDWFALDPIVEEQVPAKYLDEILDWNMKTPAAKDRAFPAWWKDNVIKVERPAYTPPYSSQGNWQGNGFSTPYSQSAGGKKGRNHTEYWATKLENALDEVRRGYNLTWIDMSIVLENMHKEPYKAIYAVANECYADLDDLGEAVEDKMREEEAKMDDELEAIEELAAYADGELALEDKTKVEEAHPFRKSADEKLDDGWAKNADGTWTKVAKPATPEELKALADDDSEWAKHLGAVDY